MTSHPIPDRIAAAAKKIADYAVLTSYKPEIYAKAKSVITALVADLQRASNEAEIAVLTEADRQIDEAKR